MKRFVAAVAAVLVLGLIGLGISAQSGEATTTVAARTALQPTVGYYQGADNHHRTITFMFDGEKMHHFQVGHKVIGGADVNGHEVAWHRTCHGDFCSNGAWLSATQVHGTWDSVATDYRFPFHAHWRYDH